MTMRYYLLFIHLIVAMSVTAQLRFTEPDSIIFWNQDNTNFRQMLETKAPLTKAYLPSIPLNRTGVKATPSLLPVENPQFFFGLNAYQAADAFYKSAVTLQYAPTATTARFIERLVYLSLGNIIEESKDITEKSVAAQAMLNAISTMIATADDKLYINYYANVSAFIHPSGGSFQLEILTPIPDGNRVKLRFSRVRPKQGVPLKVYLQLPPGEWNRETLPIYCNGNDTRYTIEKGYAVIENNWQSGFEIYFDLPTSISDVYSKR